MNVAIDIPDEIGQALAAQAGVSRAVLEAVAAEAYRSGTITTAQVQQMLELRSRWETEAFLRRAEAYHITRSTTWSGISLRFVTHPPDDRRRGHLAALLSRSDRRDRPAARTLQPSAGARGRAGRVGPPRRSFRGSKLGVELAILDVRQGGSTLGNRGAGETSGWRASGHPVGRIHVGCHHPARRKSGATHCHRLRPAGHWDTGCSGRGGHSGTG